MSWPPPAAKLFGGMPTRNMVVILPVVVIEALALTKIEEHKT